ncbi:MAG: hypothetical protein JST19_11675, partial [Bacteroidetes bacterium]|nr:hypothetical protein [Bacteroidota bacterium]
KPYIILICLFIFFNKADAQNNCSNVFIHGYFIEKFKKQEIIKKFSKDNHEMPIDYYYKQYFEVFDGAAIESIIDSTNKFNYNFIVFLPSQDTNDLIKEYCKDQSNSIIQNKPFVTKSEANFFEDQEESNSRYLFKFYYAEYKALKIVIPNSPDNALELNIPYNKSIANLNCYFVFDTIVLQPIQKINSSKVIPFDVNKGNLPHEAGHSLPNH